MPLLFRVMPSFLMFQQFSGVSELLLLRIIAVRHGANRDTLSGIFLRVVNLRPMLYIKERTSFLRVLRKSLHKGSIAVFAGMGAAYIGIDRITAHRQAGFSHDILCLDFSNKKAVHFYLYHFLCIFNT